jgi:hypothetical protein
VHAARPWASARSRRATAIVVTVPRAGVVVLRVTQVAPACRAAGKIVVHAHAGRNVVRFRGRVGERTLEPGTYRITPQLLSGRKLRSILVVVISGSTPLTGEVAAGRAANSCRTESGSSSGQPSGSGASFADARANAGVESRRGSGQTAIAAPKSPKPRGRGGVLGADFTQTLRDPTSVSPVLLILLALAIALLSLAALPRTVVASPALAEHLTNRRLELALAGTSTLLLVVLAYMLF